MIILDKAQDYQLMVGALNVLATGGSAAALPVLKEKTAQLEAKDNQPVDTSNPVKPILYYSVLEVKAKRASDAIEKRRK